MANQNRSAFVLVRGDGSYFGGFVGGGLGQAIFPCKLCHAELFSSIAVAHRFKNMIDEGLKVRRVDIHLNDV